MRLVTAAAVIAMAAGCSSAAGNAGTAPTRHVSGATVVTVTASSAASSVTQVISPASGTCNLPDRGNVIIRERVPGRPVYAVELAGTDPEHCVWTIDAMKTSVPDSPGFCFEMAWTSDNVGYNISSVPAPPLKGVQAAVGDCG